jgi:LEA14-like dessication related protein
MRRTILLAAAVGLLGCAALRQATGRFERPTLDYESWSAALDAEGVLIALHYRLYNPNDFELDLRRLTYELEVEGRRAAEGALPGGLKARPKGATAVAIPVRLLWRDIPWLTQVVLTRDTVAYRVTGVAGVASPLGAIDVPFEHRDRAALPRLPAIRIEGPSAR